MQSSAKTVDEYIGEVPDKQREAVRQLRETILNNMPDGLVEEMSYGMVGYVVPHSVYPKGYHCDPKLPLPFISLAAQKNFISFYHMGVYADPELLKWFTEEYPKHSRQKLDMGKSCIRFRNPESIPFRLIGELVGKMDVAGWISLYELSYLKKQ
jgi:uncharacterized protein YdhG (YjbR/CyaY superfamily)